MGVVVEASGRQALYSKESAQIVKTLPSFRKLCIRSLVTLQATESKVGGGRIGNYPRRMGESDSGCSYLRPLRPVSLSTALCLFRIPRASRSRVLVQFQPSDPPLAAGEA